MRSIAMFLPSSVIIAALATLGGFTVSPVVSGEEVNTDAFAMHTDVLVGAANKPILETETIFQGPIVYDTISTDANGVITKFDLDARTVTILDRKKRIRTTLTFKQIDDFQAEACARALDARPGKYRSLVAFLAEPRFVREFDAGDKTIRLKSAWLTYEARGKQAASDVADRYADFASWSKKLSTMLDQGLPAQARVELNQMLKKQNWQVVRITRYGGKKAAWLGVVNTKHDYRYSLTDADQNFTQAVEKNLKAFGDVSFFEFRRIRNSERLAANK